MVSTRSVTIALGFTVAPVFGRSFRAQPWEGAKNYMDQYTSDADKYDVASRAEKEAPTTEKLSADVAPWSPSSSTESWLKAPADVVAWAPPSSTDSWLKAPVDDNKLSVDTVSWSSPASTDPWLKAPSNIEKPGASSSPPAGTDSWLKQATDSWALGIPHAVPDATDSVSSDDVSPPATADVAQRGDVSMDFNAEVNGATGQAANVWGVPRAAVQQDTSEQRADASRVRRDHGEGQDERQSGSASEGTSASEDTSDGASQGVGKHMHAHGSIGGLFDGGEDRGSTGKGRGTSQNDAAAAEASSRAGGAVVDVRLDSELQEALRER